jgi:hypothetical protein
MSRMYEYNGTYCADTGETKQSPIVRAAASIRLWILELGVIFMIFSPVRNGFQRCGTPGFANTLSAASLFATYDSPPIIATIQLKICQARSI